MAFPTGWGRKQKITIDNTKVSGTGSHTDLPILITLDHLDAEIVDAGSNSALNGGGDVRFSTDAGGTTRLDLDIVSFVTNATEGNRECEMWVKVPSVSTSADTDIYIWYKKASETQPAVNAAFGRDAAWALAEISVLMEDATPVDHTGNHTLSLAGGLTNITGPFGNANQFAGGDRLSNTDASLRDILITHDTTVSVLSRKASFASNRPVMSFDGTDDTILYPMEDDGAPTAGVRVFWRDIDDIDTMFINNVATVNAWGWMSFTTRASDDHELYQDGVSGNTKTGTGTVGPYSTFFIGGWIGADWDGDIAQVVVWKTARVTGWITTEFNNQNSPSTFATAGTPEDVSAGPAASLLLMQQSFRQ